MHIHYVPYSLLLILLNNGIANAYIMIHTSYILFCVDPTIPYVYCILYVHNMYKFYYLTSDRSKGFSRIEIYVVWYLFEQNWLSAA